MSAITATNTIAIPHVSKGTGAALADTTNVSGNIFKDPADKVV